MRGLSKLNHEAGCLEFVRKLHTGRASYFHCSKLLSLVFETIYIKKFTAIQLLLTVTARFSVTVVELRYLGKPKKLDDLSSR